MKEALIRSKGGLPVLGIVLVLSHRADGRRGTNDWDVRTQTSLSGGQYRGYSKLLPDAVLPVGSVDVCHWDRFGHGDADLGTNISFSDGSDYFGIRLSQTLGGCFLGVCVEHTYGLEESWDFNGTGPLTYSASVPFTLEAHFPSAVKLGETLALDAQVTWGAAPTLAGTQDMTLSTYHHLYADFPGDGFDDLVCDFTQGPDTSNLAGEIPPFPGFDSEVTTSRFPLSGIRTCRISNSTPATYNSAARGASPRAGRLSSQGGNQRLCSRRKPRHISEGGA